MTILAVILAAHLTPGVVRLHWPYGNRGGGVHKRADVTVSNTPQDFVLGGNAGVAQCEPRDGVSVKCVAFVPVRATDDITVRPCQYDDAPFKWPLGAFAAGIYCPANEDNPAPGCIVQASEKDGVYAGTGDCSPPWGPYPLCFVRDPLVCGDGVTLP